ncbi:MAG TPA: ATP-binding protein, partial [Acidimicrobiales bacterium]|nr:ATP-binding protein [Acidimicrobiales bacterium]
GGLRYVRHCVTDLRTVMDTLPLGLVVAGAEGRVSHVNRAAELLSNGGVRTALAWQTVLELLAAVRSDGGPRRKELELRSPAQSLVVEATQPESSREVVAVIRDVTEMRQLEAVRRDFVANVSHELRTPIGAIAVLADALANSPAADDAERLARRVRAEADRLTALVSDLLDLSRIEAVRPDPLGAGVDLVEVVSKAVERCRPMCNMHSVAVDVSTAVGSSMVVGDEEQLVSAVSNLIENAAKYSDSTAAIDVRVGDAADNSVAIAVQDRGIGIPSWELERVFERFYRVDRARARSSGGTGLGLAIVRNVATNHGGAVSVESREGEGSTFTLTIPRASTRQ